MLTTRTRIPEGWENQPASTSKDMKGCFWGGQANSLA